MTAAKQTAPTESRYYFAGHCLFCGKNNRKRQTRKGRYFTCRHCGEINPGPSMVKAMMGHFTGPPSNGAHANGKAEAAPTPAPAAAPSTTAVATRIKAAPTTTTPTPKPAPLEGAAAPAPVVAKKKTPAAPKPPAAKKPGLFERVLYGG